ncbi:MAG: hypothetical protein JRH10_11810, partial [Deltaproteobacteria bacterium]|nr:hypothetical protein [Deltaproteobacteria bacterium]
TPLLWNDEAHTIMTGKFTLEYGYPRVTDGKNIVFADRIVDGVYQNFDEELQATTHSVWAAYYFAAFAVWLADFADDPYTRTAILRACFAGVGLLGLLLFWQAVAFRLRGTGDERAFALVFLTLMLLSVSLALHLREARYYALVFFQGSLLFYLYSRWRAELPRFRLGWFLGITACMALTFLTFFPAYFIFFAAIGLCEALVLAAALPTRGFQAALVSGLRGASPVLASFLVVLPTFGFFEPFAKSSGEVAWATNLGLVFGFLLRYEFLAAAAAMALVAVGLLVQTSARGGLRAELDDPRLSTAGFLTVAFVTYAAIVTRIPAPNLPWTRYYILLIPTLAAIGALLALWVRARSPGRAWTRAALALAAVCTLPHLGPKLDTWYGRALELRTPYRGPLDFAIPHLLERYPGGTESLVIATNYEEAAFMYYLDAKVIFGFKANNAKEDLRHIPDVVVYREWWGNNRELYAALLERHVYETIPFPVLDYPVNNIPQFGPPIPHQYQTPWTDDPERRFEIHVRKR